MNGCGEFGWFGFDKDFGGHCLSSGDCIDMYSRRSSHIKGNLPHHAVPEPLYRYTLDLK